ncbi:phosphonate ABC transporter, permease protein PhnE [Marinobacter sp. chi1]|uniref:Phosphonate ABC transporter, permease protein PhnE n=1 Tax=Marinobacter suaedae TaxID=3057675 RepID=A0ABT8VY61_9GAMM|nr:phosphonate ABC transporter, permease protein PhnE [Marinobacter sp. chi1]MDO3720922.1 phosphonate ABC transporter, permease protein PhnE [Marinobacter sp. chi1]
MAVKFLSDDTKKWQHHDLKTSLMIWSGWLAGLVLFVLCWQIISEATTWFFVFDAPRIAEDIFTRAMPPRWEYINELWEPLWDTFNIATIGTGIAILFGVPMAFLTANNTTPSRYIIRPICMVFIVASRSINSLIWALLTVAILGPGVLAGVVAISLRSIGFFAKLIYEAIEEIDTTPVEAIRATGASPLQVMAYAVWPQVKAIFVGVAVFRWDVNIRHSTVLGLVGAGGIGLQLSSSLNTLAWPQVSLIILAILLTVIFSEAISARIRAHIMNK